MLCNQVLILLMKGDRQTRDTHPDCSTLSPFFRAPLNQRCSSACAPGPERENALESRSPCSVASTRRWSVRIDCSFETTRLAAGPDLRMKMTSWLSFGGEREKSLCRKGERWGRGGRGTDLICSTASEDFHKHRSTSRSI